MLARGRPSRSRCRSPKKNRNDGAVALGNGQRGPWLNAAALCRYSSQTQKVSLV